MQRLAPAQQRRKERKDLARKLDQDKVEMMISKYFHEKMTLTPPESIAEWKDKNIIDTLKNEFNP